MDERANIYPKPTIARHCARYFISFNLHNFVGENPNFIDVDTEVQKTYTCSIIK